jgi:hypothetical protein
MAARRQCNDFRFLAARREEIGSTLTTQEWMARSAVHRSRREKHSRTNASMSPLFLLPVSEPRH